MPDTTTPLPATDPLRALVEEWSHAEVTRAEDLNRMIAPLEEAVGQLIGYADQIAVTEQTEAEHREEAATREQAAEDRRRRLEHDLKLARARVRELEQALQERTEELLRAQAANNSLAAELQSIESEGTYASEPLEDEAFEHFDSTVEPGIEPIESAHPTEATGEAESGVAERFARLRRS